MSDLKEYAEQLVKLCANEVQHMLVEFQIPIVTDSFTMADFIRQEKIRQKNNRTHQHKHAIYVAQNIKNLRNRNIAHIHHTRQR